MEPVITRILKSNKYTFQRWYYDWMNYQEKIDVKSKTKPVGYVVEREYVKENHTLISKIHFDNKVFETTYKLSGYMMDRDIRINVYKDGKTVHKVRQIFPATISCPHILRWIENQLVFSFGYL